MESETHRPSVRISNKTILLIILIVCFSSISTFVGGFMVSTFLNSNAVPLPGVVTTPTPTPIVDAPRPHDSQLFLPGKFYFEDSLIAITREKPHRIVSVSVSRHEQSSNYVQNSRLSYFDGAKWVRKTAVINQADASLSPDSIVKAWVVDVDPSLVLKESIQGEVHIPETEIQFSTSTLENEISMRSMPGYTKFMSSGEGKISINGVYYPSHILSTRIYSYNADNIQFFDSSLESITDWIAFWDSEDNFYHIDSTTVGKPTPRYQTHQLGVFVQNQQTVQKTFTTKISRDSTSDPTSYTVELSNPINSTLTFKRINKLDKDGGDKSTWIMGEIEGTVTNAQGRSLSGVGVLEYLKD